MNPVIDRGRCRTSANSCAPLCFQQSHIRIGDRVDLDHAVLSEQDWMWELDFPAHAGPVRSTEVGQVCIKTRSRVDECATHDLVVLHAPLDLTALIFRRFGLAVRDWAGAGILLAGADIRGPDGDSEGAVAGSWTAHV